MTRSKSREGQARPEASRESDADASGPPPVRGYPTDGHELIGRALDGRYLVEEVLGRGAMGLVVGARHLFLERRVAVKILHPTLTAVEEMRERFFREARASSQVSHPGVISVSDFGVTDEGLHYLVMEYLEGCDLYAWTEHRGQLSADLAATIGVQVCEALGAIHDAGYVHRDLKPENIWVMYDDDPNAPPRVKLLDLGIAALGADAPSGDKRRLTATGHTVGTVHYMSPEQAMGEPLDGRSDLYAVGCLMWELATGRCTFEATSHMAVMMKHMSEAPEAPSSFAPSLPEWFDRVALRCLAKRPEGRFTSADALREALLAGLEGRRPSARPTGLMRPTTTPRSAETGGQAVLPAQPLQRRAWPWLVAAGLFVAGGVGGIVALSAPPEPIPRVPAVDPMAAVTPRDDGAGPEAAAPEAASVAAGHEAGGDVAGGDAVSGAVATPDAGEAAGAAREPAEVEAPAPATATVTVTLVLDVAPEGARVTRDGEEVGRTPLTLEVPHEDVEVTYVIAHAGRLARRVTLSHGRDAHVSATLARRRSRPAQAKPTPSKAPDEPEAVVEQTPAAAAEDGEGDAPASEIWRPAVP